MTITADHQALHKRPARQRDLAREIAAINDLARGMVRRPDALQRRFVELALDLCRAGSAEISMLEEEEHGESLFRWTALAGEFAPFIRRHVAEALQPLRALSRPGQGDSGLAPGLKPPWSGCLPTFLPRPHHRYRGAL